VKASKLPGFRIKKVIIYQPHPLKSPSPSKERGKLLKRGAPPLLDTPDK